LPQVKNSENPPTIRAPNAVTQADAGGIAIKVPATAGAGGR